METPDSKKSKKNKSKKPKSSLPEDDTSNDLLIIDESSNKNKSPINRPPSLPSTSNKKRKKRDSASSDEERWLTAIESGKLEDVDDELKKIKPKDPALMTARQRAMYDRGGDGNPSVTTPTLMSLPTGYKEKVMTAEAIQKAAIKSQKRKQLADEKREKDKKKTMERLLKKQESKAAKSSKNKIARTNVPTIMYRQNASGIFMSFPPGMDWPLNSSVSKEVPKPVPCIMGCGNLKKYSCSQTQAPLCSLTCYKKNIANFDENLQENIAVAMVPRENDHHEEQEILPQSPNVQENRENVELNLVEREIHIIREVFNDEARSEDVERKVSWR